MKIQSRPIGSRLSGDKLFGAIRSDFEKIPDLRQQGKVAIPLSDAVMSAFAMFSLKAPSLLHFHEETKNEAVAIFLHQWTVAVISRRQKSIVLTVRQRSIKPLARLLIPTPCWLLRWFIRIKKKCLLWLRKRSSSKIEPVKNPPSERVALN